MALYGVSKDDITLNQQMIDAIREMLGKDPLYNNSVEDPTKPLAEKAQAQRHYWKVKRAERWRLHKT